MTMKQIQNLLQFLDFYEGIPDGDYGPKTAQATREFQSKYKGLTVDGIPGEQTQKALRDAVAYGMPTQTEDEPETGDFWDEIEFFTREEFRCKCGGKYCNGFPAEPREKLVRLADQVRKHFGKPATVISGLRCETHNANEGGVVNSRHMYGEAVDLKVQGVSAADQLAYVNTLPGVRYAYTINSTNVHFDVE